MRFFVDKFNARVELPKQDHVKELADSFLGARAVECIADAGDPAEVIVRRAAADGETLLQPLTAAPEHSGSSWAARENVGLKN